jgi:hypothetical protein
MTDLPNPVNVVYPDRAPWLKTSYEEAKRFLQLLDPTTDKFTFQTFDDNEQRKDRRLARILNGTLDECFVELSQLNTDCRAGVYFTVNATDLKGRELKNISRVRSVWGDFDRTVGAQPPLPPSIVVSTSPGKWHVYWLCEGLTVEQHRGVEEHIALAYGSDRNAVDAMRVLRLPGFWHRKAAPSLVTLMREHSSGKRYTAAEILQAYPPIERAPAASAAPAWVDTERVNDALRYIPAEDRNVWRDVGAALKHQYGEQGFEPWRRWSKTAPHKYDEAD